jgi:hypothetical protein
MNCPTYPPKSYPVETFYPLIANAIREMLMNAKAPDAMVSMVFTEVLTIACQGLADVLLPTGHIAPLSQNFIVLAKSGERKSFVERRVAAPIYAFDKRRSEQYSNALRVYKAELHTWKSVDAGLQREITKAIKNGSPIEDLCQQARAHAMCEPVKPRLRRILRQDMTARALMEALEGDGESIAIVSSEGKFILNDEMASQVGLRNSAWDGADSLSHDRGHGESLIVRNPRMTQFVMIQPDVWLKYLERHGDDARASGQHARTLFAWPVSTQGDRITESLEMTWENLQKFCERVNELLDEYERRLDAGSLKRDVVEFSDEAKVVWLAMQNDIEENLRPNGLLADVPDIASKAMEMTGRLAATFHYFSRLEGKISVDTLCRANEIIGWHVIEFKRLFTPPTPLPQYQLDAQTLEQFLHEKCFSRGCLIVFKNDLLQFGPNAIRSKGRLDPALDFLRWQGRIQIGQQYLPGKKKLSLAIWQPAQTMWTGASSF